MPWSLLASVLPLIFFVALLGAHVVTSRKSDRRHQEEHQKCIRPIVKIADEAHRKKFGKPSTELVEVFPELKAVE